MTKENNIYKPILFSTPMVQAILDGRKTQTRRIIKPQPIYCEYYNMQGKPGFEAQTRCSKKDAVITIFRHPDAKRKYNGISLLDMPKLWKSKYQVGDILWVRETWMNAPNYPELPEKYYLKASKSEQFINEWKGYWKPSIFMPKDACRIFLKVKNVRVERLEDITKEDAINEGIEKWQQQGCTRYKSYVKPMEGFWDIYNNTYGVHPAIASFRSLWASINGFKSLNSNPYVFVYEFERYNLKTQ